MQALRSKHGILTLFKHLLDIVIVGVFFYFLYNFFFYKANYLNTTYGPYAGCETCFTRSVLAHDGAMLGLAGLFFFLSLWVKPYLLAVLIRVVSILVAATFIFDVIILENFSTRLNPSDFFVYGDQFSLLWEHMSDTVPGFRRQFLFWSAVVLVMLFFPSPAPRWRFVWAVPALSMLGFIVYSHQLQATSYVQEWAMRNVVANMVANTVATPYSDTYRQSLLSTPSPLDQPYSQCLAPSEDRPDIILLILESWSPYQSALWGGFGHDWTPKLDALAQKNRWFSNLHAGGFTTNEGLMSLLNGEMFFSPIKSFLSIGVPFESHWNWQNTLPKVVNKAGYHSVFLTSGDLSFSRKGEWVDNLGFDYYEGHDHPSYEGLPRSHFRSAPDDALYARAVDYYQEKQIGSQPVFMAIENVSTHPTFLHPYTRERDEEAVFRFMDDTVHNFYENLDEHGFFDEGGYLIVVSDHRSMTPLTVEETEKFGRETASLIPGFIVGPGVEPEEIKTLTHQADLLPSVAGLLTQEDNCLPEVSHVNLFDPEPERRQCVFHARGDDRDHIDVFCPGGGEGQVTLDGDDTAFNDVDGIAVELQADLIHQINRVRVEQQQWHEKYLAQ